MNIQQKRKSARALLPYYVVIVLSLISIGLHASTVFAGTTPPSSSHVFSGTAGLAGWYRSSIDVTITTEDNESGPDTTTYWIDSDAPTVVDHLIGGGVIDQFENNSFEKGSFLDITDWYKGVAGWALYYRSSVSPYDKNRDAAIAWIDMSGDYFYWHNEPEAVAIATDTHVRATGWVRKVMGGDDDAYFEVWGQDSSGNNDTLLATSNKVSGFSWSWQQVSATFTVPAGTNYVYIKVGGEASPAAIVYWDLVELTDAGSNVAELSFNHAEEGVHTLHYFSTDNNGNVEGELTADLKIDTVVPSPWQSFVGTRLSCAHCYDGAVTIQDSTSGIDVSSAEYRFYTEFDGQYWSSWLTADSVNVVSTGLSATDGETSPVKIHTPETDFGNNAPFPWRFQFRVTDMAGNVSTSPIYEISSPWIRAYGGSIYIAGEISLSAPTDGGFNANADVFSGDLATSITTSTNWIDSNYEHASKDQTSISSLIPLYEIIKTRASALPGGDIPKVDGIYLQPSDYTISSSTLPSGYGSAQFSAVVIIEGDLHITGEYTVDPLNNTVFLVEGNLYVDKNVEDIAGFFIVEGTFVSDVDGDSKKQLHVDGSVVAFEGYEFSRDLGTTGPINNTTDPADLFTWRPTFVMDETLAGYLTDAETVYIWQETEQ